MRKNYLNLLFLSAAALSLPAAATVVTVPVPASQAEFESQWFQIRSESAPAWEWVDHSPNYARVHPEYGYATYGSDQRGNGQGLFMAEGIEMTAGEIYKLQVLVTTSGYDDDHAFQFAYTTDKVSYTPVGTDGTIYNDRGETLVFKVKPTSTTFTEFTVPEDGVYYLGLISRGGKNKATSYLNVASISYEKKVDYPVQVSGLKITNPASAALEATISWTWPTKSDAGAGLEGVNARIYRGEESSFDPAVCTLLADVEGVPGEAGSYTDTTVPAPGKYYYFVQTYYGDGVNPSPKSDYAKWIGEDVKCLNLVASRASLAAEGNGFRIDFEKRVEGYNGGWVDPEQVFIKITRQKNDEDPVVVISDYQGESPYIDAEVDGPGSYTYRLYVVYKDVDSSDCKVGPMFGGGAESIPYSEDFSDYDALNNFTVLYTSSSNKWSRNYNGYLQFNGGYYSAAKSNALTPPVALEAGKTYKVTCVSWVDEAEEDDGYGDYWGGGYVEPVPQDLVLTAGKLATFDGQAQIVKVNVNKGESEKMTVEAFFSPEESGNYYFGFQSEVTGSDKIYLDDIEITESVLLPADVADFTVVADPAGAKQVTVSFTVPSTSNGGLPLAELTSVTVTRLADGVDEAPVVVKALEGEACVPGAPVEFVDEVPVENNYVYTVVAALDDKLSNPVSSEKMWVGYDYPKNVSSFSISLGKNENDEAVLTWTPLSGTNIARNGGYVDAENLKYRIYRITGLDYDGPMELVAETDGSPFVDASSPELPWDNYRYAVSAVNGHMEGDVSPCNNTKVLGDAISLPYEPDFTDEYATYTWDGRGFVLRNGMLSCYNKGEKEEGSDFSAVIPPFYSLDSDKAAVDIDLTLSRDSEEYEEVLEIYAVRLGDLKPSASGDEENNPEAKVSRIAGNETLIHSMVVTSLAEDPQKAELNLKLPSTGKYRIRFRMGSDYNEGINIHSMKISNNTYTGISSVVADGSVRYDAATGRVLLGQDVLSAEAYSASGVKVASVEGSGSIDLSGTEAGIYLVRAVKTDGKVAVLKLVR